MVRGFACLGVSKKLPVKIKQEVGKRGMHEEFQVAKASFFFSKPTASNGVLSTAGTFVVSSHAEATRPLVSHSMLNRQTEVTLGTFRQKRERGLVDLMFD